jgi:hypothetical protein
MQQYQPSALPQSAPKSQFRDIPMHKSSYQAPSLPQKQDRKIPESIGQVKYNRSQETAPQVQLEESKNSLEGLLCEAHSRTVLYKCLCARCKVYLCDVCAQEHLKVPNQPPLLSNVDIESPEDIPKYAKKTDVLQKVIQLSAQITAEKTVFKEQVEISYEAHKETLDNVFNILREDTEKIYASFLNSLQLAQEELERSLHAHDQQFSPTTMLFLNYATHLDLDLWQVMNLPSELDRRLKFRTSEISFADDSPFETKLASMGEICVCEECELLREQFKLVSQKKWTCLKCGTVRQGEVACKGCGCGKNWEDYLVFIGVTLKDHNKIWVCTNCGKDNRIDARTCFHCKRPADKISVPFFTRVVGIFQ